MSDKTFPTFARLTMNGQRSEFSLHNSIHDNLWNNEKWNVRGHSNSSKQINASLDLVKSKL